MSSSADDLLVTSTSAMKKSSLKSDVSFIEIIH